MIKQLNINHFRSISKASLEFVEGVNVLVGLPDAGKSNVLRSLSWVLNNRPLGKRMLSDFADKPCFVEAIFNDKKTNKIGLFKSKTSSKYFFNDKELNAVGSNVPEEILSAANMTELNFQRQLDQPFLITLSAGETAKVFNRITRLDKSDEVVSMITTDINSTNKKLKQSIIEKERIEKSISELGDIDQMEEDIDSIEKLNNKLQNLFEDIDHVRNIISNIKSIQDQNNCFEEELKIKTSKFEAMKKDYEKLLDIEINIKTAGNDISGLSSLINKVLNSKKELETSERLLKQKASEYKDFLSTIDICPFCSFCKEPIKKHDLDSILKGLL